MASVAQVLANRSNAQKSTGPRTAEGKAIVAQNAVKHGLLAQRVVVKGEDPGQFALHREQMLEDLDPVGSVETILAERVVNLAWRLRRAERLEGAALDVLEAKRVTKATPKMSVTSRAKGQTLPEGQAQADEEAVLAQAIVEDFGRDKLLDQLLGYERRIENSLYRTMGELRKQRLLRGLEYRLQAGQESEVEASMDLTPSKGGTPNRRVNAELRTRASRPILSASNGTVVASDGTPCGVTTNGAQNEDQSCQTNPIGADSLPDQAPLEATPEEVGRGRPSYEEGSGSPTQKFALGGPSQTRTDAFGNQETPGGVATNGAGPEEPSWETKPIDGSGVKGQEASGQT